MVLLILSVTYLLNPRENKLAAQEKHRWKVLLDNMQTFAKRIGKREMMGSSVYWTRNIPQTSVACFPSTPLTNCYGISIKWHLFYLTFQRISATAVTEN